MTEIKKLKVGKENYANKTYTNHTRGSTGWLTETVKNRNTGNDQLYLLKLGNYFSPRTRSVNGPWNYNTNETMALNFIL